MDVNNTYFHLLLNRDDWLHHFPDAVENPDSNVVWDARGAELTLRPELFRFRSPGVGGMLTPEHRRGAARDRYGTWYWIDADRQSIRMRPPTGTRARRYWSPEEFVCQSFRPDCHAEPLRRSYSMGGPGDFQAIEPEAPFRPGRLSGLAITRHQYMVVGTDGPDGLLVFDLHGGGPPAVVPWPVVPFRVVDIAARPGGGVWILAADDVETGPFHLWKLNRRFEIEHEVPPGTSPAPPPDFVPEHGAAATPFVAHPPEGTEVGTEHRVLSIDVLQDDSVILMEIDEENAATYIRRYRNGSPAGGPVLLNELLSEAMGAEDVLPWLGHDMAFVGRNVAVTLQAAGDLVITGRDGNQAFSFELEATVEDIRVELARRYLPMRRFSGKALVADEGEVYYDFEDEWIALTEQPRPRFAVEGTLNPGAHAFDGKKPDCVWHRLIMEACIPPGTSVRIESRAANTLLALAGEPWTEEPAPYLRGSGPELPFYRFGSGERRADRSGSWELLFQRAAGRFLQIRFRLKGSGRATPRIRAVRLHYPRFSYLNEYLPAVYREEQDSASFVDRFLANTEGLFTELEGRIAAAQMLIDERTAPREYLQWLAGWMGIVLDGSFGEDKRRLFLAHAPQIFQERGTRQGLIRMVRFALHPCPDESLFRERYPVNGGTPSARVVARDEVRITEDFLSRKTGRPVELSAGAEGPAFAAPVTKWTPSQGTTALHAQFRTYLQARVKPEDDIDFNPATVGFSPVRPASDSLRRFWDAFRKHGFAFPYEAPSAADAGLYRAFLRHRYRGIARLNAAYGTTHASFEAVSLPSENDFPSAEPRLADWLHFVSIVLPVRRHAHRFNLLVSTDPAAHPTEQGKALALAARIVNEEKPAHTVFDVVPFWAVFRVGSARLGSDTVVDQGSRFLAIIVGAGELAAGFLAPAHPFDVRDRVVTGRDRPGLTLQF